MKSNKEHIVMILVLAVIISSLIVLSIFFQRTLQRETAEQFNRQQLLLAETEASDIRKYLNAVQDELLHIARLASSFRPSRETDYKMMTDVLFKDSSTVKKRVVMLDSRGTELFSRGNVHAAGPDEQQVTESARRLCPADVLVQQDGKMISLVAPVCRYDTFTGALLLSIDIADIAKTYLGTIKSGTQGYAWMMDEKGNLLYHPTQPNMVGRNLYKTDSSCFKCHQSFDIEKKIIEGRGDYYGRQVAPTGEDKILAFSMTEVGTSRWIVAISAPYSEITKSIKRSMKFYSWIIILIFITTIVISAQMIISQRKKVKAEAQAKYERELEMMQTEKLASLERLTSGITSEIGNPLTSVFSFVRILMDMEEDEFKKETLDTIFLHMNRMADILKQLSGFSKTPSEFKSLRVNSVIEDSLSLIQYDKRVQDITVVKDLSADLPPITTDGNQLSQVIVNIVLNAADAMPNGGTLTIRSRLTGGTIVLDFEDTGIGIDKESIRRVFEPFYTTKEKGTGLGLAVSYGIIKKLKGSLTAESEMNKGSRFTISLPVI